MQNINVGTLDQLLLNFFFVISPTFRKNIFNLSLLRRLMMIFENKIIAALQDILLNSFRRFDSPP